MCIGRRRFPAKVSGYARSSIGQSAEHANIRRSLQILSVGILVFGDDMSEHDEKRGGSGCAIGAVIAVVFVPVFYVLSIRPAAWMVKGGPGPWWLEVLYYPVAQLAEHSNTFRAALTWYMDLWAG